MPIQSRDKLYSGNDNDGSFLADDALPANNNEEGFLKKFFISNIAESITGVVMRSKWIRTLFYQTLKAFAHLDENKARSSDIGVAQPSTVDRFVAYDQLPEVLIQPNDFTLTTVPTDGVPSATQNVFNVVEDLTGKNRKKTFKLTDVFVKFLLSRLIPTGGAANQVLRKVDGNAFNVDWINISSLLPSVNASKLLFVNANNINDGDGSSINPFRTIDLMMAVVDPNGNGTGGLMGAGYTILIYGGSGANYTTNKNLSTGNQYYFYPGAVITYTGTTYLFDSVNSYDIKVYGYGDFVSETGGIVNSTSSDATTTGGNLIFEFNNITHSHTGNAFSVSGYFTNNPSSYRKNKLIKFNTIISNGTCFNLGSLGQGANCNIYGTSVTGLNCVKITNAQVTVNFENIRFNCYSGGTQVRLENASAGTCISFKNCEFYAGQSNIKIFDFNSLFQNSATLNYLYILNCKVRFGSATVGANTVTVFNCTTVPTFDIRIAAINFIYPTNSLVALYNNVDYFTQRYPAGLITYTYDQGE